MKSKLLVGGKIIENNKLVEKNILIEDNKIKQVSDEVITVEDVINVDGKLILPGVIDCHVHFREPGLTQKEDFLTGSKAAAAGGITTILDMPNTIPPTTTIEALNQKIGLAKKSIVNYGLHFGATPDNTTQIKNARNIASVKVYMDSTTGNLLVDKDEKLVSIFKNAKTITAHAEGNNIQKAIDIMKQVDNKKQRLHICHVSSAEELKIIKKAKTAKLSCEVTPHHLFLTKDDENELTKMKPSLKTKEDQEALWQGIEKGVIDVIATDHAPHTIEEKKAKELYGVPGCETMLLLLIDAVHKKKLGWQRLIELTAQNPAKIFKLKNKGFISEGYDADLVIVDLDKETEIKNEDLFTKCRWSPFNGWKLHGHIEKTIINGSLIYDNRTIRDIKARGVAYYE